MNKAAFYIAAVACSLAAVLVTGCAKKSPEPEFRPLQIHWIPGVGEDEESMPTKDNCVIRLTAKLMGEDLVQASPVADLAYRVAYGKSKEEAGTLYFTGVCVDAERNSAPECLWKATCSKDLDIVVKFHNGD